MDDVEPYSARKPRTLSELDAEVHRLAAAQQRMAVDPPRIAFEDIHLWEGGFTMDLLPTVREMEELEAKARTGWRGRLGAFLRAMIFSKPKASVRSLFSRAHEPFTRPRDQSS